MLDSYRELVTPDDPYFFKRFMEKFIEALPGYVAAIEAAIRRTDTVGLALAAHALKSSCLNVGAGAIVERSAKLEALGKSGSVAGAEPLAAEVAALCARLGDEVRALTEFQATK